MALSEPERRSLILRWLYERLEAQPHGLLVKTPEIVALATAYGLEPHDVIRSFKALLRNRMVIGEEVGQWEGEPGYSIDALNDEALTSLGELPAQGIDAVVAVLDDLLAEVQRHPTMRAADKSRKAEVIEAARGALLNLAADQGIKALWDFVTRQGNWHAPS